jgi:GMP reductase
MNEKTLLSYGQICLLPKYSIVESRAECDTSYSDSLFTGLSFKIPVMPANMKCCIDISTARWLSQNEYFYSMHRFDDTYEFIRTANEENWIFISISVGVKKADFELIDWIIANNMRVDCITIDIAHGHSSSMKLMVEYIKCKYECLLIAGNVCTPKACLDLKSWGADMVKVGIAQGGACTTYGKTGFGTPMFTTVLECSSTGVPIVADGGIKTNGDISKAFVAGAKLIMAGSMFAACINSPGDNVYYAVSPEMKVITHKKYFGSASAENKKNTEIGRGSCRARV